MMKFLLQNESSTKTPLVFVHGFLGQPSMWMPTIERLQSRAPTALAVLPGHGLRPWFPESDSFFGAVDALLASLPFSAPAHLVGYSMGARLALAMILRQPKKFQSAVFIGVDPGLDDEAQRHSRILWDEQQASQIEGRGLESFAEAWASLPLFATQSRLSTLARNTQQEERRQHTAKGVSWAMRRLGLGRMPSLWGLLPACSTVIHLITGSLDDKFTRVGAQIATTAQRARHYVIDDVGHNVALEAPAALAAMIDSLCQPETQKTTPAQPTK